MCQTSDHDREVHEFVIARALDDEMGEVIAFEESGVQAFGQGLLL